MASIQLSFGKCIRFSEQDIRPTGRSSMGVGGMVLSEGDEVIGMQMASQGENMLLITEKGMGKRTPITEFKNQKRYGMGIKCYNLTDRTGTVMGAKIISDGQEIMLITTEGIIIRINTDDISLIGRDTSGVKVINIEKEEERVASIAKVRDMESSEEDSEENTEEEPEDSEEE